MQRWQQQHTQKTCYVGLFRSRWRLKERSVRFCLVSLTHLRFNPRKFKFIAIVTDIQESLHDVSRNIDRVLHRQHDREQQAILDWLKSVDYSPQQNDFIGRRQEGTGQWLVESDEFQQWENNKKCILFCPGIPGSGKTMMVSIVVDHLFKRFRDEPGIAIAFLYCNFRQQQEQRLID